MKNCNEIVEDLLERRADYKKRRAKKVGAVSVCCMIAVIGIAIWNSQMFRASQPQNVIKESKNHSNLVEVPHVEEEKTYRVYTDSFVTPKHEEGVEADLIGSVTYKGHVYLTTDAYFDDSADNMKYLIGEYLGEATGSLLSSCVNYEPGVTDDEREWRKDFASTYTGKVYTVKGYDESFRLCIYNSIGETRALFLLDNYDGIGLNTGSDLYVDRLRIKDRITNVGYLTGEEWDNGEVQYKKLDTVSREEFEVFLEELYNSPFEKAPFDHNKNKVAICLELEDGTQVKIWLFEGGYVWTGHIADLYVKMSGEMFDTIYNACQE